MNRHLHLLHFSVVACLLALPCGAQERVRLTGSSTLAHALKEAAPMVKEELGIDLIFGNTEYGSTSALRAIGVETADVAMVTRPLVQEDRSAFPSKRFFDIDIGTQVLVPIVPLEVWEAGVRSIAKDKFIGLYEADLKNWSALGGEDREIKFFNPKSGEGIWELFVTWLYGDIRKAPLGKHWQTVLNSKDARDSVEFNAAAISVAPPKYADGKRVFALAIKEEDGSVLEPTEENFHSRRWPMTRPLLLATAEKPTGAAKKLLYFMVSPSGEKALRQADFLPRPGAEAEMKKRAR